MKRQPVQAEEIVTHFQSSGFANDGHRRGGCLIALVHDGNQAFGDTALLDLLLLQRNLDGECCSTSPQWKGRKLPSASCLRRGDRLAALKSKAMEIRTLLRSGPSEPSGGDGRCASSTQKAHQRARIER